MQGAAARRPPTAPSCRRCGAKASPRRRAGPKRGLGRAEHPGRDPGAYPSAGDESGACAQECGPLRGCGRGVPSSPGGGDRRLGHSAGRSGLRQAERSLRAPHLGRLPALSGKRGLQRGVPAPFLWLPVQDRFKLPFFIDSAIEDTNTPTRREQ